MRPNHRGLIVTVAGVALLALGIAFAVASAPKKRARPTRRVPAGTLDCKLLDQQLRQCGVQIAVGLDPSVGTRLAKQPPTLQGVLRRSIVRELVARVANPCYQRKGRLEQGAALQACVKAAADHAAALSCPKGAKTCKAWRLAQQCAPLAACLKKKIDALPKPKAPQKAPAGKTAP